MYRQNRCSSNNIKELIQEGAVLIIYKEYEGTKKALVRVEARLTTEQVMMGFHDCVE